MKDYLILIPFILIMYFVYKNKYRIKSKVYNFVQIGLLISLIGILASLILKSEKLKLFFVLIPIIITLLYTGIYFLKEFLRFNKKTSAIFVDFKESFKVNTDDYVKLVFKYKYKNNIFESATSDDFEYDKVRFRFDKGGEYTIHIDEKLPSSICIERFMYAYYALVGLLGGLGLFMYLILKLI